MIDAEGAQKWEEGFEKQYENLVIDDVTQWEPTIVEGHCGFIIPSKYSKQMIRRLMRKNKRLSSFSGEVVFTNTPDEEKFVREQLAEKIKLMQEEFSIYEKYIQDHWDFFKINLSNDWQGFLERLIGPVPEFMITTIKIEGIVTRHTWSRFLGWFSFFKSSLWSKLLTCFSDYFMIRKNSESLNPLLAYVVQPKHYYYRRKRFVAPFRRFPGIHKRMKHPDFKIKVTSDKITVKRRE